MKTDPLHLRPLAAVLAIIGAICLACLTGCAAGGAVDDSSLIQKVLDQVVPANFEGDLHVDHTGHYFGATITLKVDLRGLKKTGDRWTWASGGYTRSGVFSNGGIELTPKVAQ